MDISNQYILMCEKAEEIQQMRIRNKYEGTYSCEYGDVLRWNHSDSKVKVPVWLPRQDQLQQIIINDERTQKNPAIINPFDYTITCIRAILSVYRGEFDSWEKFWLVTVMHLIYHKVWKDNEWVSYLDENGNNINLYEKTNS